MKRKISDELLKVINERLLGGEHPIPLAEQLGVDVNNIYCYRQKLVANRLLEPLKRGGPRRANVNGHITPFRIVVSGGGLSYDQMVSKKTRDDVLLTLLSIES